MSENFNKNCYTSRSSGYKYRTLSTNTGERKRRESKEENAFDRKFKELKCEITSRIFSQMKETQQARESIQNKFAKINSKIDSLLELQNTVTSLRKDLHNAENTLANMLEKVEKLEVVTASSDTCSLQSPKSSHRSALPVFKAKDNANVTQTVEC